MITSVASWQRTGDEVHETIAAGPELTLTADHREPGFLAQVYLADPGTGPLPASGTTSLPWAGRARCWAPSNSTQ